MNWNSYRKFVVICLNKSKGNSGYFREIGVCWWYGYIGMKINEI